MKRIRLAVVLLATIAMLLFAATPAKAFTCVRGVPDPCTTVCQTLHKPCL